MLAEPRAKFRAANAANERVTMRTVVNHWSARRISFALAAGSIALGVALMLGWSAAEAPKPASVRLTIEPEAMPPRHGGETVISKLDEAARTLKTEPAIPVKEPTLKGLGGDIPWERAAEPAEPTPKPAIRVFAQTANATNSLPWDAIEPVPFESVETTGATPVQASVNDTMPNRNVVPQGELPASGEVERWVKAKATTLKGENRGRPIYHFELWLDAPDEIKQRLATVAYDFNTPAVMPQSQISSEEKTGFRVAVGGLACADNITVTLKFDDGRTQQVAIDGCRLLS
jgi:hypothetical protein